jgi:hypothetical protein
MKITILYKGGSKTTTVEAIPSWARPYIENVAKTVSSAFGSGQLSQVAGTNNNLNAAFGGGARAIGQQTASALQTNDAQRAGLAALAQTGGVDQGLEDAALLQAKMNAAKIGGDYASRGTLGSARQANAVQNSNAQLQAALAKEKFGNQITANNALSQANTAGQGLATNATSALAQLGQAERGITQQGLDATWQGLERFASAIYGNPARQQAVASGGGK